MSDRALYRELSILDCDRAISGLSLEDARRASTLRSLLGVRDDHGSLLCAAALDLALVPPSESMPENVKAACLERVLAAVRTSQSTLESRRAKLGGPLG